MERGAAVVDTRMERERFSPEIEPLLLPIPGGDPSGPSVRYDPVFLQLRQAREEDDPNLPMGEWERPLKRADWRAIATQCSALLASRTKDLQLAGWLCEAWTRQHGVDGFLAGAQLLDALVERFWDGIHPVIDDGDTDSRVAPFVWMNENLALTLRLHVPLVTLPGRRQPHINLATWEKVISGVAPEPAQEEENDEEPLSRELIVGAVDARGVGVLHGMAESLRDAAEAWDALSRMLDDQLALDAPSLGKVSETLRKMQRACTSLMNGREPRPAAAQPQPQPVRLPAGMPDQDDDLPEEPIRMANQHQAEGHGAEASLPAGPITSRADAYRLLEAAAEFLQRTEPHSPAPYLIRRAVSWGQMSLADLMQEIMREEGDLSRYFSLLGINTPRE